MAKWAILGAGSWATALSMVLNEKGHNVTMWEFRPDYAKYLSVNRRHPEILPDVVIPKGIVIENDIEEALWDADVWLVCVPSHAFAASLNLAKPIYNYQPIVCATKGLSEDKAQRMSELASIELGKEILQKYNVLSGPSHAEEVAVRIPTAVVLAGSNKQLRERLQTELMTDRFRVYTSTDLVGVELSGSLKNIIALASGILDGLGMGDNTKGALMARGLAEITRLGTTLGASPQTFAGLAGVGDLITTCISKHSRNRNAGERIGRGETLKSILETSIMVIEGVKTTKAACILSDRTKVEMPITRMMKSVLFEDLPASSAVDLLMRRSAKPEWD
jgi:glycerol-3-phosphate dehydrogenase (NAD(P)+)